MFCFASLDGARERSRSHPSPASRDGRRAKIPSPQPPSFLPACWKPPAIFSDGGGAERKERIVALAPPFPCARNEKLPVITNSIC